MSSGLCFSLSSKCLFLHLFSSSESWYIKTKVSTNCSDVYPSKFGEKRHFPSQYLQGKKKKKNPWPLVYLAGIRSCAHARPIMGDWRAHSAVWEKVNLPSKWELRKGKTDSIKGCWSAVVRKMDKRCWETKSTREPQSFLPRLGSEFGFGPRVKSRRRIWH